MLTQRSTEKPIPRKNRDYGIYTPEGGKFYEAETLSTVPGAVHVRGHLCRVLQRRQRQLFSSAGGGDSSTADTSSEAGSEASTGDTAGKQTDGKNLPELTTEPLDILFWDISTEDPSKTMSESAVARFYGRLSQHQC